MGKIDVLDFIGNSLNAKVTSSTSCGAACTMWLIDFGETYFYIECAWRLSKGKKVLVTYCDDFKAKDSRVRTLVRLLEGRTLLSVSLSGCYDLTLLFDEEYRVDVFSDCSLIPPGEYGPLNTNWYYVHNVQNKVVEITDQVIWKECRTTQ